MKVCLILVTYIFDCITDEVQFGDVIGGKGQEVIQRGIYKKHEVILESLTF